MRMTDTYSENLNEDEI
ncbi:Protein of unknown function [Bacillus cereus]|nr:Protein of unknown function [Bacillus cereus]